MRNACTVGLCLLYYVACLQIRSCAEAASPSPEDAARGVLDRVLPGASSNFTFKMRDGDCGGKSPPCFIVTTSADGNVRVEATGVAELTAGTGYYLRSFCNLTFGWPRGGGSHLTLPTTWPAVPAGGFSRRRNTPYSYMMNVCTASYSLVWYSWSQWEAFIDWMALSGVNLVLGLNGQEEVQYKVFRQFNLTDDEIRGWFNGPAFLTWSRGQNEYGAGIAGPLPRSWMQRQWSLQKQILGRYRSLGITAQLPGFQGNVPVQLKSICKDANITAAGATGWMDSLDPLFGEIADAWMKQLIQDFGTDHWYQLDGYFNGGTAPWMDFATGLNPAVADKQRAVATTNDGSTGDVDEMSYRRGVAAYQGLNRTDPAAVWSFQGWAFINWESSKQAAFMRGFIDATPEGKFVIIDMSRNGAGEWHKWNDAAFFGAKFIWTTLHDFGGNDGIKGNLSQVNEIPFAGMAPEASTNVVGTGVTPEGIDQNPVYYEFAFDANWREARVQNLPSHIVERSMRRYALKQPVPAVVDAWRLLVSGAYAQDLSVHDPSGLTHLPGSSSQFQADRFTPTATLCTTYQAWLKLLDAAASVDTSLEPFRYDLVNLGRELLAQLATPLSQNFSDAVTPGTVLDASRIKATGQIYIKLLQDVDRLLATDPAFMVGPWIASARYWGSFGDHDCAVPAYGISSCADFYEWNARVQLTTWNPTPKDARKIPSGPIDYASKHWSGLTRDYYAARASLVMAHALDAAAAGSPVQKSDVDALLAQHAFKWSTATAAYPTDPTGDYVQVSKEMVETWGTYYSSCVAA